MKAVTVLSSLAILVPAIASADIAFPARDVFKINHQVIYLIGDVGTALQAPDPARRCFHLGRASNEKQNLLEAIMPVATLLDGLLLSNVTPPDWLTRFMRELLAANDIAQRVNAVAQPCTEALPPGKLPVIDSSALADLQARLLSLSDALDPYVQRAISELEIPAEHIR